MPSDNLERRFAQEFRTTRQAWLLVVTSVLNEALNDTEDLYSDAQGRAVQVGVWTKLARKSADLAVIELIAKFHRVLLVS